MATIKDGQGNGVEAGVTSNYRLKTISVTLPVQDAANRNGKSFHLNTGLITLTNALQTSVFYVRNNEESDLILDSVVYGLGTTTNGSGDARIIVIYNPTAGDIITNANPGFQSASNLGSTETLDADIYIGASGETKVTGSVGPTALVPGGVGSFPVSGPTTVIPRGRSIAIDIIPPAGNTSQNIQVLFDCHLLITEI